MWTKLKTVFGIDLRTLALFRILLGVTVLADVLNRWPYASMLYSDQGAWPRAAAMAFNDDIRWSLLYVTGQSWLVHLVFAALALTAAALIVGYRTRLATAVAWVLLASVCNRNLIVLQGGDTLLCLMLFWSLFLPLGARFSFDDAMRSEHEAVTADIHPRGHNFFGIASIALLLQTSYVYVFGALLKTAPEWTQDYSAIYYALSLESFARPLADWFSSNFSGLLSPMTAFVYWLELLMPIYMFTPIFFLLFRSVGLFLLVCMHIGFALFLNVGLFPLISILSLSAFLPGAAWDWFGRRLHVHDGAGWTLFYDQGCSFCRKTCLVLRSFCLPYETPVLPAQADAVAGPILERETSWVVQDPSGAYETKWAAVLLVLRANPLTRVKAMLLGLLPRATGNQLYAKIGDSRGGLGRITQVLLPYRALHLGLNPILSKGVLVLVCFVFAWNFSRSPGSGLKLPTDLAVAAKFLRLNQTWNMFAPKPSTFEGYYGLEGRLVDGSLIDLWTKKPGLVSIRQQENLLVWAQDYRWRKIFGRIHRRKYSPARRELAKYWCRQTWRNAAGEELDLAHVTMTFYGRYTQPDGRPDKLKTFKLHDKPC